MTTDPAVQAAAEALMELHGCKEPRSHLGEAHVTVAAARPIIEAEIREESDLAMIRRDGSTYDRLRKRWEAEVRERIAADIEAHADRLYAAADMPTLAAGCLSAARIARARVERGVS